jgi:hypothetical protein
MIFIIDQKGGADLPAQLPSVAKSLSVSISSFV